jgi:hypothetical protein
MSTLHHTIIAFFEKKMADHNRVRKWTRLQVADEFIYFVERSDALLPLNVFLSDAYSFGRADFLGRPRNIKAGDYILIARPEASYGSPAFYEELQNGKIGIGKIGELMGALNYPNVWEYEKPADKKK